jgi:hypothetical protein
MRLTRFHLPERRVVMSSGSAYCSGTDYLHFKQGMMALCPGSAPNRRWARYSADQNAHQSRMI